MSYELLDHPHVALRDYAAKDLDRSCKIIGQTLGEHSAQMAKPDLKLLLEPIAPNGYTRRHDIRLADTHYIFARTKVATFKGKIVGIGGVCRLNSHDDDMMEVDWFAIASRFQRKGLGTRFMRWMLREAESAGVRVLFFWSVASAVPFYEKFGFRRSAMKIRPRESSILMVKKIR